MSSNVAIRQIFDDALEESEIRQAARIEQIINDAIASALKAPSAPRAPPLSLPDAQRELGGLSRRQLYRLAELHQLEFIRIGKLVRVTRESIDRLLAGGSESKSFPQLRNQRPASPAL